MRFLFFFSFCFLEASDIVFYILFLFSVGRQHLLMDVAPLGAMTLIVPKYINMNLAPRAAAARSRPLSFPHKKTSILFMRRPSCPPLWYVTFDLGYCWRLSLTKETRQKLFPLSLMALYYFTAPKGYYVRTTTTFHSFLWLYSGGLLVSQRHGLRRRSKWPLWYTLKWIFWKVFSTFRPHISEVGTQLAFCSPFHWLFRFPNGIVR